MQKKYSLLALAFALILGTIVASLPIRPAKALEPGQVRFYVVPTITTAKSAGTMIIVEVWVESDPEWENMAEGIVGWGLSVRVDPRALEVMMAAKIPGAAGFLESFLATYFYDWEGYTTSLLVGPIDKDQGTILDISEYIIGYEALGVGAGGGPHKLMRFGFRSKSETIPSVIDLFGIRDPEIEIIAMYTTPDGAKHYVDVLDDGYYITQLSTTMGFDSETGWDPLTSDPTTPPNDWEELWPSPLPYPGKWWSLENWIDNDGDEVLSELDQVHMYYIDDPMQNFWFYVDYVNQAPVAGDGGWDLIVTVKPDVPEFPLGAGLMIMIAPAIPIVYLWRKRKWVGPK